MASLSLGGGGSKGACVPQKDVMVLLRRMKEIFLASGGVGTEGWVRLLDF